MIQTKKLSFIFGLICGAIFAPVFFLPAIFALSILARQISFSENLRACLARGYLFGFGFFITSLYWISFAPAVYIDQFWWAIPFALFGLPSFLALFIAFSSACSFYFKESALYHFMFCIFWLLQEWLITWVLTGLPWAMLGYGFAFSEIMIQSASIFGVIGLSFIAVYIGSIFYSRKLLAIRICTSLIILSAMIFFGINRLTENPTNFSEIKARLVQPSIKQTGKWDINRFWKNLDTHVKLSKEENLSDNSGDAKKPDIIIWSEAALTAPYHHAEIHKTTMSALEGQQVLLFGGVNDNASAENYELYSSFIGLKADGSLLFDYHKAHLVPFGEYIPLQEILPIKKLTHGMIDFTAGKRGIVHLPDIKLNIQPQICYESIFSEESKILNDNVDLIVNVTNDAWYGTSSGPYQHLHIARMRSVENGLPMLRAANNGITAIIDPVGRIIKYMPLNNVGYIESYIPVKIENSTAFSRNSHLMLLFLVLIVLAIQPLGLIMQKKSYR